MPGETHAARYLIPGGRIYDHDGDIHQPRLLWTVELCESDQDQIDRLQRLCDLES